MTDFGFDVQKQARGDYVTESQGPNQLLPLGEDLKRTWKIVGAEWSVSICQADFPIISEHSKSGAVREMEEFIRQAQEALARLRALE